MEFIVTGIAIGTTAAFVRAVWRRRDEPTAPPLLGVGCVMLAGVIAVGSVVHLDSAGAVAATVTGLESGSWLVLAFVYPVLAMGLWVPFGLQYTGRGDRVAAAVVIVVGALALGIIGPLVGASLAGFEAGVDLSNFLSFVALFVMGSLSVVSLFVIIDESLRVGGSQLGEAVVLSGGVGALLFAPVIATVTDAPSAFLAVMAASSALFVVAVGRDSLFETLPVARIVGRNRAIDELPEAVIVVDRQGIVRDVNPAAQRYFGEGQPDGRGQSIEQFVGFSISLEADEPVEYVADGRYLAVTSNRVTDNRDRLFGYLLVCQDITARRDREQRLGLLTQLLVGALGERMDAVTVAAKSVDTTDNKAVERTADEIWTETTALMEHISRAREIDRALETGKTTRTDCREAVKNALCDRELPLTLPGEPVYTQLSPAFCTALVETLVDVFAAATDIELTVSENAQLVIVGADIDLARAISEGTTAGVAVEMCELAVTQAGGSLSVTTDGRKSELVIAFPKATPEVMG